VQTVLPALLTAAATSTLTVEGGTHNPGAPPFDFLAHAFLPLIERMGPRIEAVLDRPGFAPAGSGRCTFHITPATRLAPLTLLERGPIRRRRARALVARLARHIADRELATIRSQLGWSEAELEAVVVNDGASGSGNALLLEVESEHVTELFSGFGAIGVRAEAVAERVANEARRYLAAGVPVGPHLADQLLLPVALSRAGEVRTVA
jgi:RNA 3'-terminal phosphate cyclase (ATP)